MEAVKAGPNLIDEVATLVEERFLEGLVRQLEKRFSGQGLDVDGAVGDAVETLVRKADTLKVSDPRAYLYTVAYNKLRRNAKQRIAYPLDAVPEEAIGGAVEDMLDEAFRNETFKYLKTLVERWENTSLKATALILMEASFLGEPLTTEELAEQLEDVLGEEISLATVRQWRKRSLDRLEAELHEQEITD